MKFSGIAGILVFQHHRLMASVLSYLPLSFIPAFVVLVINISHQISKQQGKKGLWRKVKHNQAENRIQATVTTAKDLKGRTVAATDVFHLGSSYSRKEVCQVHKSLAAILLCLLSFWCQDLTLLSVFSFIPWQTGRVSCEYKNNKIKWEQCTDQLESPTML